MERDVERLFYVYADVAFQDKGCSLNPKCLECPFAQCRYDSPRATFAEARRQMGVLKS